MWVLDNEDKVRLSDFGTILLQHRTGIEDEGPLCMEIIYYQLISLY